MNIKNKLKKSKIIMISYDYFRNIDMKLLTSISPVYASKYIYKKKFKKILDLQNPSTFNEKLMWLKLYWENSLKSICADKYAVREYIKKMGEENCLNELYSVYNYVEDIEWDKLPNEFVLKVTNTCGANIICNDKSKLNEKETLDKLTRWMKDKFYFRFAEIHYKDIKPTIICEKYLKPEKGLVPIDYKVYCFNGEPKVMMLCTGRGSGNLKYHFCDLEGNILPFDDTAKLSIKNGINKIELPHTVAEMYRISSVLSKNIPFVRIDFYDHDGKVVFGEMTFTPCACLDNSISEEGEHIMGDWIKLPKNIKIMNK